MSDALFQTVIHYLCNIDGRFWFVIAGVSEGTPGNTDEVLGKVFVFKSKADWKKAEPAVRKEIASLNNFRLSLSEDRDSQLDSSCAAANAKLADTADIAIDFCLNRSGEIFFTRPNFRDALLEDASNSYAQLGGHDLSLWVANQTYFFVRDISHRHQHHVPTSDTILILQTRNVGDRLSWRRDIIYSLQHYIIRAKRFADGESLAQSAGVLGYCMSFRSICNRNLGDQAKQLPSYNDEALLQSLNSRAQQEQIRLAEWQARTALAVAKAGNNRSYALVFVTLIVAVLAALVQPRVAQDAAPALTGFSDFAISHLPAILFLALGIPLVVWLITYTPTKPRHGLKRDILELANVYRGVAILVVLVFLVLVAGIVGIGAWAAIKDIFSMLQSAIQVLIPG